MTDQTTGQQSTEPPDLLAALPTDLRARVQATAFHILTLEERQPDDPYVYEISHFLTIPRNRQPAPSLTQEVKDLLTLLERGVLIENNNQARPNHLRFSSPDRQRQWAAQYLGEVMSEAAAGSDEDIWRAIILRLQSTLFHSHKLDEPFSQILRRFLEDVQLEQNRLVIFLINLFEYSGHIKYGPEFLHSLTGDLALSVQELLATWKARSYNIAAEDRMIFQELLGLCNMPMILTIRTRLFPHHTNEMGHRWAEKDDVIADFLDLLDSQQRKGKWTALLASLHEVVDDMQTKGTRFIDFANYASLEDREEINRLFKLQAQLKTVAAWQEFLAACQLSGLLTEAELGQQTPLIVDRMMAIAQKDIIDQRSDRSILRQLLHGAYHHPIFRGNQKKIGDLMEKYGLPYDG